jgi:hypothetical protein
MRYLYGSHVPLFRFQRGLLLPGLPRAWITEGGPLAGRGTLPLAFP